MIFFDDIYFNILDNIETIVILDNIETMDIPNNIETIDIPENIETIKENIGSTNYR